jgi:hypothetical protein
LPGLSLGEKRHNDLICSLYAKIESEANQTNGVGPRQTRLRGLSSAAHSREKSWANDWAHPFWWDPGSKRRTRDVAKIIACLPPDAPIRWGNCGDWRFVAPITVREFGKVVKSWQQERNPRPRLCDPKFCSRDLPQPGEVQTWSGPEVLDEGKIRPKWVAKILDHKDRDERTRAYQRETRHSEYQEKSGAASPPPVGMGSLLLALVVNGPLQVILFEGWPPLVGSSGELRAEGGSPPATA